MNQPQHQQNTQKQQAPNFRPEDHYILIGGGEHATKALRAQAREKYGAKVRVVEEIPLMRLTDMNVITALFAHPDDNRVVTSDTLECKNFWTSDGDGQGIVDKHRLMSALSKLILPCSFHLMALRDGMLRFGL
jgi:hypothetical protein